MYNDLLLDRLGAVPAENQDERILELITEIEDLDNLLSPEAQSLIRDLRPRTVSDDVYEGIEENATFGDHVADELAIFAGSWNFILLFAAFMAGWITINALWGAQALDPAPFILLNLGLSTLAAFQGPIILMSQNRQAIKDRAQAENDYQVNLKNELEIVDLHRKIDLMMGTIEMQNRLVNALVVARRQELNATVRAMEHARREDLL